MLDAKETRSKLQSITGSVPRDLVLTVAWERKPGRRKSGTPGSGRTSIIKTISWNYGIGADSSNHRII